MIVEIEPDVFFDTEKIYLHQQSDEIKSLPFIATVIQEVDFANSRALETVYENDNYKLTIICDYRDELPSTGWSAFKDNEKIYLLNKNN